MGRAYFRRLRAEPLEDRRLLAVFTVTNLDDLFVDSPGDAPGTLRQAIFDANQTTEPDTIDFDPTLFNDGPQVLDLFFAYEGMAVFNSAFRVLEPLTIIGPDRDLLTLRVAEDGLRHIDTSDSDFAISGLTLTGGNPGGTAAGGAIAGGSGSLTVEDSRITDNIAGVAGGGISIGGSSGDILSIIDTEISHNFGGGAPTIGGGGVAATLDGDATLRIENSQIELNETSDAGGGLRIDILLSDDNRVVISGSSISHNTSGGVGGVGGILLQDNGTNTQVSISDTTISSNIANERNDLEGGGVSAHINSGNDFTVERALISDNVTTGQGGGFYLHAEPGSSITIRESRITGNILESIQGGGYAGYHPHSGGGIYAILVGDSTGTSRLTISDTTIDDNQVIGDGAGIFVGTDIVGALDVPLNELAIVNSTVSGNVSSLGTGGGISLDYVLAYTNGIDARFQNVTITDNAALSAGGLFSNHVIQDPANVQWDTRLSNTLISGNTDQAQNSDNLYGSFHVSESFYNLIGDDVLDADPEGRIFAPDGTDTGFFTTANGNIDNSATNNPLVGPLAENGGFTLPDGSTIVTHELISDPGGQGVSPAIDAGDPQFDPLDPDGDPQTDDALLFDERGNPFIRVADGDGDMQDVIDIGAFEVQAIPPDGILIGDYNENGIVDAADYTVWRDHLGQDFQLPNEHPHVTPGMVTSEDYDVWVSTFGATLSDPPPSSLASTLDDANADGTVNTPGFVSKGLSTDSRGRASLLSQIRRGGPGHALVPDSGSAGASPSFLSSAITQTATGNIVLEPGQTARFAPLTDHGAPTLTHALMEDSPAIDAGSNAAALDGADSPLEFDQRKQVRPNDWDLDLASTIDLGARELAVEETYS